MNKVIHKPVLIVIAGPNGSGKTSVTSKILHHEWMEDSMDAIMQAAKYSEDLREQCLLEHKSLIFETVLSAKDKVDYICRAIHAGFFVRLFFVCTASPTINASRIANRVMEGGHDVPIPKIISRYHKSLLNCCLVSKLADRTYIYDNSIENSDATLLFRLTKGQLAKQYVGVIPEWAYPIFNSNF